MNSLIIPFSQIDSSCITEVGGKNASLGEMYNNLAAKGVAVPDGFAVTAFAFEDFLQSNNLHTPLFELMRTLDRKTFSNLKEVGKAARMLIMQSNMHDRLKQSIQEAYAKLSGPAPIAVAVRSSATAEDLPEASFAGQHESYLNINGADNVVKAVHQCYASLYTDRAIKYREDHGFAHEKVALSAGVQKMVRSDKGCAGIAFTLEPESGFRDIIQLSGVWGLGENIVQGTVTPDDFLVFKPTLRQHKKAILQKRTGSKLKTMIYAPANSSEGETINIDTPIEKRNQLVLNESEITQLANWCLLIEEHYQKPMDIEWAKDGETAEMFIVQARPETVHTQKNMYQSTTYQLLGKGERLAEGQAIGSKMVAGIARILSSPEEADKLNAGEIIITDKTSPDWDPILKKSAAIVTNKGGRTSHASIVARELGVPAIVGTGNVTEKVTDGEWITVSCAEGKTGAIYKGKIPYREIHHDFSKIKKPETVKSMLITADPEKAFSLSMYPNDGVGLLRMEFIITHFIKVHPMALVKFNELKDDKIKREIQELTSQYADKEYYFSDKLAQGIATIAAAFYPKEVIVRMSDFKSNEYANLLGGKNFEPAEENPMLGFRGASRYYHPDYQPAFRLECEAIKQVREDMGLTNVKVMIPFCRTLEEGRKVIHVMAGFGLDRIKDPSLEIYMMTEIPSNVLQLQEFSAIFDGFSIGSNDLTQLTLGIDRDSALVSSLFDENNKSAKLMITMAIQQAKASKTKIGLCGQAPSDYPAFARFLVQEGINSISFNADAILKGIDNILEAESELMTVNTAKINMPKNNPTYLL